MDILLVRIIGWAITLAVLSIFFFYAAKVLQVNTLKKKCLLVIVILVSPIINLVTDALDFSSASLLVTFIQMGIIIAIGYFSDKLQDKFERWYILMFPLLDLILKNYGDRMEKVLSLDELATLSGYLTQGGMRFAFYLGGIAMWLLTVALLKQAISFFKQK